MRPHELAGIAIESLVAAADGAPFCRVVATLATGQTAVGQLTPGEVVAMATDWIAAAQAARDDAAVVAALVELLVSDGTTAADAHVTAVGVLDKVRETRQTSAIAGEFRPGGGPNPNQPPRDVIG